MMQCEKVKQSKSKHKNVGRMDARWLVLLCFLLFAWGGGEGRGGEWEQVWRDLKEKTTTRIELRFGLFKQKEGFKKSVASPFISALVEIRDSGKEGGGVGRKANLCVRLLEWSVNT